MKRVLLVDDDPLILKLFRDGLTRHDFQVETAADGLEAMRALRAMRPDIVVLDLMMPKLSGVDVLKFIRGQKDLAPLPVIVLSNSYVNELAEGVRVAGVQEALLKSRCTPSALASAIDGVLKSAEPSPTPSSTPPVTATDSLEQARRFPGQPTTSEAAAAPDGDAGERVRGEFLDKGTENCQAMRALFDAVATAQDEVQRSLRLEAFYRKVHFVTASAGITGCERIGKMSSVLEALLFVLIDKPAQLNPGVLRTISNTLELIEDLFRAGHESPKEHLVDPQILVVDDDPLSNRLGVMALRRAELHAFGVEDPLAALQRLETTHYDLILLDVEMPGLDGFEFCRRVRAMPKYKRTPIIYVTSHTDLETRTEGLLSGGTDVITKPIFPMELAVKSVAHLLKAQLPA